MNAKKLISGVLTVAICFTFAAPAFAAAPDNTVIPEAHDHGIESNIIEPRISMACPECGNKMWATKYGPNEPMWVFECRCGLRVYIDNGIVG